MDIQRIEFPKELLVHNLSATEEANIPTDKLGIAKDWNIIKRQNEWLMRELVFNREVLVNHETRMKGMDEQLELWNRVRWGIVTLFGAAIGILTILQKLGFLK